MDKTYDAQLDGLYKQILDLFKEGNATDYGEPQVFIELKNGRSIEITLEQYELPEDEYYYSVRLHCSRREYENNQYQSTCGVIVQYATTNNSIEKIKSLLITALKCNDSYPLEIEFKPEEKNNNVIQNKWEMLFNNLLELLEFSLIKNETHKVLYEDKHLANKEYQYGFWGLKDLQGGNLGNICGERFATAAQIIERMEIYIDDYIVFPLQEIRKIDKIDIPGYSLNEYMQWEGYVKNRELFRKDYQSDIDYLDMIYNHADEINLNKCTYEFRPKTQTLSLDNKINCVANHKNENEILSDLEEIIR